MARNRTNHNLRRAAARAARRGLLGETRGGARTGAPGVAYPNRVDLNTKPRTQPVRAPTGQPYGVRGQQIAAQQAIPLPGSMEVPGPSLTVPTNRPEEPVTAGLPLGPGPGPEILAAGPLPVTVDEPLEILRALAHAYPDNRELLLMLALAEETS